jgi:hypothetical protein
MKFTVEEAGSNSDGFLTLPDDAIIQVMVDSIEERHVPGKDGKEGWDKLNFRFKIVDLPDSLQGEFGVLVGSTIFGSVSARLTSHPDNKLRQWAEALLDLGELETGFELDTDMLVGRKARGVVGQWTRKADNSINHQIKGLLPLAPASVGSSGTSAAAVNLFGDDEPPF